MSIEGQNHIVRVRIAEPADAERIMTVINSAFRLVEEFFIDGDRIDIRSIQSLSGSGKFLLAEGEGIVFGCVYVEAKSDRAYLGLLAVDPAHQQCGLGSLLMNAAEDYGRGLGCRFMDIRIVNLRRELPAFYQKRGYVETGTSPFPPDVETKLPCSFIEMSKSLSGD